jgi:hypothetical protein
VKIKKMYYIYPSTIDPNFRSVVRVILTNNTIWTKWELTEVNREHLPFADFTIKLVPRRELDKYQPSTIEFYTLNPSKPIRFSYTINGRYIYIDADNWQNGVPESGLTLRDYRKYVTLHEVGHALGYDHKVCDDQTAIGGKCPIMYQMTRGPPPGFAGVAFSPYPYSQESFLLPDL